MPAKLPGISFTMFHTGVRKSNFFDRQTLCDRGDFSPRYVNEAPNNKEKVALKKGNFPVHIVIVTLLTPKADMHSGIKGHWFSNQE